MRNVLIANSRYGVSCTLLENEGFSGCIWDKVTIWKCVRGLSVDINNDLGQYVTYNCFYNVSVSSSQEKGVFLHCRAVNSCVFRDCLFDNIAFGPAFEQSLEKCEKAAICVINETSQGSVIVDGGCFENIYHSKDKGSLSWHEDKKNSVFLIDNINLSIDNVRFANTRTVVNSKGKDNIQLRGCIDNCYYTTGAIGKVPICNANENTILFIDNYVFGEKDKVFYKASNGKIKVFYVIGERDGGR